MSGLSDYTSKNLLNYLTGQVSEPALPSVWMALFTAIPTSDAGTGGTEVSGGSYARQQVAGQATTNGTTAAGNATLHFASTPSWIVAGMSVYDLTSGSVIPGGTTVLSTTGTTVVMSANAAGAGVGNGDNIAFSAFSAATGSTPSSITNNGIVTFVTPTAGWGNALAWGLYDAATVGNLLAYDWLGNFGWLPATVSSASPGILTVKAHGYSASDPIVFSTEFGGTAPSFSQSNFTNTVGTLLVTSPATDSFSLTNAGTAVNTSSTGSGMVRKITVQNIATNVVASFAASQLTLQAA